MSYKERLLIVLNSIGTRFNVQIVRTANCASGETSHAYLKAKSFDPVNLPAS
jgi:hypothetical protein